VAVELHNARSKFDSISSVLQFVTDQLNYLITARPTAVNMIDAAKRIIGYLIPLNNKQQNVILYIDELLAFMEEFLQRDLADNHSIGQYGVEILCQNNSNTKKLTVLTHCNTGSLATVGFGTALGIIRQLAANSILQLVYFTETRPYNQGSRLTAYELVHDRIPHTMICDSMVGLLMRTQAIHAVIVGADCITANGDTANKIGTYQLAILAKHHDIPFYIAAPTTSIDLTKKTGHAIFIEQRPSSEMTTIKGINIAAEGVHVWNPAFDITPAQLITAIITEHGVFKPDELEEKLLFIQRSINTPSS
jgi:methylthioribose-1-phosphate isomerase